MRTTTLCVFLGLFTPLAVAGTHRAAELDSAFGGLVAAAETAMLSVPPLPAGARKYTDLAYVTSGHVRQKLDLYLPAKLGKHGPFPVIVYIHGGGWKSGSKSSNLVPVDYVERGWAVASLDYRLSGDAIFPAQIEDCKAAVRWLRANAGRYDLDPERFAAWGESAGGHLASMLGTTGTIDDFDVGENRRFDDDVQAVVAYYGPTDFLQMDAHALPGAAPHDSATSAESLLIGGAIQTHKRKTRRANPIRYVDAKSPPFFLAHGDADMVVPHHQSELLQAALQGASRPVTLVTLPGAGHNFENATAADRDALAIQTRKFLAKSLQ